MSSSDRVNEVACVSGQLGDLSELLAVGDLSDLGLQDSFVSGVLGFLGSFDELLLDGVGLSLGFLDLTLSFSSVVLSFLGFLLSGLNNSGGTLGLLGVDGSNGSLLDGLSLLGLLSSLSLGLSDGTVVLDGFLGKGMLSFLDEFHSLDDGVVDLSELVSQSLLSGTLSREESLGLGKSSSFSLELFVKVVVVVLGSIELDGHSLEGLLIFIDMSFHGSVSLLENLGTFVELGGLGIVTR